MKRMLIDASHPEETRVVVLDGSKVEEFDFEAASKRPLKGNIYLAKVTRVEPSLQAAFVEYGGNRHGFLAFGEIHPDYYRIPVADRQAALDADRAAEEEANELEDENVAAGLPLGDHPIVGEIAGTGLVAGVQLARDRDRRERFDASVDIGTICRDFCFNGNLIMRATGDRMLLSPPLVIRAAEVDEIVDKAKRAFDATAERVRRGG